MRIRPSRNTTVATAGFCVAAALMVSCSSPPPPTPEATALWGDMKPIVSTKELMRDMIDPASDLIFNAVGVVATKEGTVETVPTTDEDWDRIRYGAVTLAEGIYLFKVRRPWTPPGDENNSIGPDAPELSPAQIQAKVEADPVEWNARIEATRNAALNVMGIVERRDVDALLEAGEIMEETCEACHQSYWYPKEDAEFYRRLIERLEQYGEGQAGEAPAK